MSADDERSVSRSGVSVGIGRLVLGSGRLGHMVGDQKMTFARGRRDPTPVETTVVRSDRFSSLESAPALNGWDGSPTSLPVPAETCWTAACP